MNFNNDKPIEDIEKDLLNRKSFIEEISCSIIEYFNNNNVDPLTIGLIGEWGSGKSSILNLIENKINDNNDDKIIIVKFNPWIYSSYYDLVDLFFDEIITSMINKDSEMINKFDEMKKILLKSIKFQRRHTIKKILNTINIYCWGFRINLFFNLSEPSKLKEIKENINNEMKNYKILCIIDDIDRLTNDEIIEIFKLIKNVCDFNNMIYLLAFDYNIVSKVLKEIGGDKYTEKIINVHYDVPATTNTQIWDIIKSEINEFDSSILPHINIDENHIDYFFDNIRDVRRFLNVFKLIYLELKDEICPFDLFVMTEFFLFKKEIYYKIKSKRRVLHHKFNYMEVNENGDYIGKGKSFLDELINELSGEDLTLKNTLTMLFNRHRYQSILDPECFDTFFNFNKSNKTLTHDAKSELMEILNAVNSEKVLKKFNKLDDKEKIYFYDYLRHNLTSIKNYENFIKNLLLLQEKKIYDLFSFIRYYTTIYFFSTVFENNKICDFLNEINIQEYSLFIVSGLYVTLKTQKNSEISDDSILNKKELDEFYNLLKIKAEKTNIEKWDDDTIYNKFKFHNITQNDDNLKEIRNIILNNNLNNNNIESFFDCIKFDEKNQNRIINDELNGLCDLKIILRKCKTYNGKNKKINDFIEKYEKGLNKK